MPAHLFRKMLSRVLNHLLNPIRHNHPLNPRRLLPKSLHERSAGLNQTASRQTANTWSRGRSASRSNSGKIALPALQRGVALRATVQGVVE